MRASTKERRKLTAAVVSAARPGQKIWDTEDKKLFLRVMPSGVKAFLCQWHRTSTLSLGKWPGCTVDMARKRSLAAQHETAETGMPEAIAAARGMGAGDRMTLSTFVEDVYKPWAEGHLKDPDAMLGALEAVWKDALYSKQLADISELDIERVKAARKKAGRKPSTVNRDLDRIRAVLSKAVDWGKLTVHPMKAVKRLRGVDNTRIRYLSGAEDRALRDALEARENEHRAARVRFNKHRGERGKEPLPVWGPNEFTDHLGPLVTLAVHTGMRRGELFGIRWRDVSTATKTVTVPAGIAKSRRARHIPLNAEALDVLKRWRPKGARDDALVFPAVNGQPMTNINRSWDGVVTAAKLTGFRFHDLRHTFASRLVMAGVDLNTVRELLGHSDLTMTLRYAHLAPNKLADAVAKLVEVRK